MTRFPLTTLLLLAASWGSSGPGLHLLDEPELTSSPTQAPIRTWIWQFDPELGLESVEAYKSLLEGTGPDARILVAVTADDDFELLVSLLGGRDPRLEPLEIGRRISAWARDRYVIVPMPGHRRRLVIPAEESVGLDRRADLGVARKLAAFDPRLEVVESGLAFEGGNILVGDDLVILGAAVIGANLGRVSSPEELVEKLRTVFGRAALILGADQTVPLPHEHVDMYLSLVGPRHVLLGDPALAAGYFRAREDLGIPDEIELDLGIFGSEANESWIPLYDEVDRELREAGFIVERLPVLHGTDGVVITWTNVVVERRADDAPVAFVPEYGIPYLDRLAASTWERAGFAIVPVKAGQIIRHGGAIRCLTNVLERDEIKPRRR